MLVFIKLRIGIGWYYVIWNGYHGCHFTLQESKYSWNWRMQEVLILSSRQLGNPSNELRAKVGKDLLRQLKRKDNITQNWVLVSKLGKQFVDGAFPVLLVWCFFTGDCLVLIYIEDNSGWIYGSMAANAGIDMNFWQRRVFVSLMTWLILQFLCRMWWCRWYFANVSCWLADTSFMSARCTMKLF